MSITTERDPVDALVEILEAAGTGEFRNTKPEIYRYDSVAPKGKANTADDAVYVFEAAGLTLDRFGVEPGSQDEQTEDGGIQIQIWALDATRAKEHGKDIVRYLQSFLSDNYSESEFLRVEPESLSDSRAAKTVRQTDHYVYSIEVATHRL